VQRRACVTVSLYEQVMGPEFARLDAPVQAFHRLAGTHVLQGQVRVEAPWSPLARLAARLIGAPAASGKGPMRLELVASADRETWHRHFPTGQMASRLEHGQGCVVEHLGPLRLEVALEAADGRLVLRLLRMRLWGLPCPSWLLPQLIAEESGRSGQLHFLVRAAVPLVGPVLGYTGYLELPAPAAAAPVVQA